LIEETKELPYVLVQLKLYSIGQHMQKLDQLGCPSIWLGYSGESPERLFSLQMSDLAEDATCANYVVSTMVNKLSKSNIVVLVGLDSI